MKIMYHARKSLLFCNEKPWMKREENLFVVSMRAYGRAEICELVRIFTLNKIREKHNKNDLGLYRDDGLTVLKIYVAPTRNV